jgi:hypothetical protein
MSAQWIAQHEITQATVQTDVVALSESSLLSNPRPHWRGFFVGYSFYFGFFGDSQTPARAGATMTPE